MEPRVNGPPALVHIPRVQRTRQNELNVQCNPSGNVKALCDFCRAALSSYAAGGESETWKHYASVKVLGATLWCGLQRGNECPLCFWLWDSLVDSWKRHDHQTRPLFFGSAHDDIQEAFEGRSGTEALHQLVLTYEVSCRFGHYSRLEHRRDDASGNSPLDLMVLSVSLGCQQFGMQANADCVSSLTLQLQPWSGGPAPSRPLKGLLEHWVIDCLRNHPACGQSESFDRSPWRPTRLLRICATATSVQSVRLCEGSDRAYDDTVRYTTLSHRWTTAKAMILQVDNRTELMEVGIQCGRLKQSLRDAILCTHRLGVAFIWVDTLCIIQDDPVDTAREVSQMHRIYGNSLLTIAASMEGIEEGFLKKRPMSTSVVCLDEPNRTSTGHYMQQVAWHSDALTTSALERTVLASRAWVFQERLLSPRVVHFFRGEAVWECRSLEASEIWPQGHISGNQFRFPPLKQVFSSVRDGPEVQPFEAAEQRQNEWREIVQSYSACDLTFIADKLHALAGISARWQQLYGDEYVFGCWRSTIVSDLCWKAVKTDPNVLRRKGVDLNMAGRRTLQRVPTDQAVAPSWSWASMVSTVSFSLPSDLLEHQVDPQTIRLVGIRTAESAGFAKRVETFELTAEKRALELQGHLKSAGWDSLHSYNATARARLLLDHLDETRVELTPEQLTEWPEETDWVDFDEELGPQSQHLVCMPVVREDDSYTVDMDEVVTWGLALVPVCEGEGIYRRVGVFLTYSHGLFNGPLERIVII